MLTRLRVQNFKNLRDVEVYFGPLTVIAGPNGVGKSNLLDAIQFLGNTAAMPLAQAALQVRGKHQPNADIRKLFFNSGNGHPENIKFEADFQIPKSGEDYYGQEAIAAQTSLRYSLEVALSQDPISSTPIGLVSESLVGVLADKSEVEYFSLFKPGLLRMLSEKMNSSINVPQSARHLSLTALGRASLPNNPTAVIAQLYLKSWMKYQLQLEQLMAPSLAVDPPELASDGGRTAAALFHLAKQETNFEIKGNREDRFNPVYHRVLSRLSYVVPDLESLWVQMNENNTVLTLQVEDRWGNIFSPQAISEGSLRLIAFATLAEDELGSPLCLIEEPESGIHPRQMYKVLDLLRTIFDSSLDFQRQVIVSTHSPSLVAVAPEDSVLFASQEPKSGLDKSPPTLRLQCLSGTWRGEFPSQQVAAKGDLIQFLGVIPNPATLSEDYLEELRGADTRAVFERREFLEYKLQSAV